MSATAAGSERTRFDLLRWPLCLLLVLVVHGAAMLRLREIKPAAVAVNAPPALMLDLAPLPAPPTVAPTPPAPVAPEPPPPVATEPPPPESAPLPPEPQPVVPDPLPPPAVPPEVALPRPVPPKLPPPVRHAPAEKPKPAVTPPPDAMPAQASPVQAAPPQAAAAPGAASASWESAVAAYLAQFKRYPVTAQRRGEQGVALIRFSVDRAGMVHGIALVRSSGHADLDGEAQSLVDRAQPLPKPPADVPGTVIELVVPVHFSLH